jgi:hypothetical protein
MEENPIRNNCLIPHSLVMTKAECDYCASSEHSYVLIGHLFGLKTCSTHRSSAIRDCRSYMHTQGFVKISDLQSIPIFQEFIAVLSDTFTVVRTSGVPQAGWKMDMRGLMRYRNSEWHIPAYIEGPEEFIKDVRIRSGFRTSMSADYIDTIIQLLNNGIYMKEWHDHEGMVDRDRPSVVEEDPHIKTVTLTNGKVARIWV